MTLVIPDKPTTNPVDDSGADPVSQVSGQRDASTGEGQPNPVRQNPYSNHRVPSKKRSLLRRILSRLKRISKHYAFSSLTRRIIFLNLAALIVLLSGILYMNQFRDGLLKARVDSLRAQGEIIAGSIAISATIERDTIYVDPEKLAQLQAGETIRPGIGLNSLEFLVDPEKILPALRKIITPTRTHARIYNRDGFLVVDSRSQGKILRYELENQYDKSRYNIFERFGKWVNSWLQRSDLEIYTEQRPLKGTNYPEVMDALTGVKASRERVTEQGRLVVSVAVPIQRYRTVLGVLLLTTQGGDIDEILSAERLAILRVFGVACVVTIILSLVLAGTIANPLRRLSAAANRVRHSIRAREEIPDFAPRQDEIGDLSTALRAMTNSLYDRIDAIESFAADVSHELKNPLTSLRSAVETLPVARTEQQRSKLLSVIEHDVRRLDRLITDISDASRLDAELVRDESGSVDVVKLLENIVAMTGEISSWKNQAKINLDIDRPSPAPNEKLVRTPGRPLAAPRNPYFVAGHESRIGQVINNLLDNARSFVPDVGGEINIRLSKHGPWIEIRIEDNGPGIPAENIDRIFERFYTDRPGVESFGQNSGLGLSITKQIVEAHNGTIHVENIYPEGINRSHAANSGIQPVGTRFVVALPHHPPSLS